MNPYRLLYELLPESVRRHFGNVVGLIFSWATGLSCIWAAQWQQEILEIIIRDTQGNGCYWLPLFFLGCQNVWAWRDIWQGVVWFGAVVCIGIGTFLSIWFWDD
jgi:hypothetical protein